MQPVSFDDIRPYNNSELQQVLNELFAEPAFKQLVQNFAGQDLMQQLERSASKLTTVNDFQQMIVAPALEKLVVALCSSFTHTGAENLKENSLVVTNHRDIVIDPAFLDLVMLRENRPTVEIGIGNNLFAAHWIELLVRLNKCFVVKRGLPRGEQVHAFLQLSAYIRHAICQKHESVWIAQREGRAKDSNDRTQESILKMFALSGDGSFLDNLKELNICPTCISYEYDPCDYLKAKEFQLKRDNADYQKSKADDVENMLAGIKGYKGAVHYAFTPCINDDLDRIANTIENRKEQVTAVTELIDQRIHSQYQIYDINKVAYDELLGQQRFVSEVSSEKRARVLEYFSKQLAKIDIPNKDEVFLRTKLLEMYANPLINKLAAIK